MVENWMINVMMMTVVKNPSIVMLMPTQRVMAVVAVMVIMVSQ